MSENPLERWRTQSAMDRAAQSRADIVSYEIGIKVAFTGFKRVPWLCISHNSFSPRLVLGDADFLCKVIVSKRRRYAEVESVDVKRVLFGRRHLTLTFRDSIFTFVAQAHDEADLCRALTHLQLHSVEIREGAREFIRESCAPIV